ncbi:MAG: response regulator [Crocinitomicaceae bacterium]
MKLFNTILFALLIFVLSFSVQGQIYSQRQLNEALKELPSKKGKQRIRSTLRIAEGYMGFDLSKAEYYSKKASSLSVKQNYAYGTEKSKFLISKIKFAKRGCYYNLFEELDDQIEWFEKNDKVLDFAKASVLKIEALNAKNGNNGLIAKMDKLIAKVKPSNNHKALALLYFHRMKLRNPQDRWEQDVHLLDSARYYASFSKDPVLLSEIRMYSTLPTIGGASSIDSFRHSIRVAKKLGRKDLLLSSYNYLLASHSIYRKTDSLKHYMGLFLRENKVLGENTYNLVFNFRVASAFKRSNEIDSCIVYATKALKLSQDFNFENRMVDILNMLGLAYIIKNENSQAITILQKALSIGRSKNLEFSTYSTSRLLGSLYSQVGRYEESEEVLNRMLKWANGKEDNPVYRRVKFILHVNMSQTKEEQKKYAEALEYLYKAKKIGEDFSTGATVVNDVTILNTLIRVDSIQKAKSQYDYILSHYGAKDLNRLDVFSFGKAELFFHLGDESTAIQAFNQFLETANSNEASETHYEAHIYLAKLYANKGDYRRAHTNSLKALEVRKKIDEKQDLLKLERLQSDFKLSQKELEIQESENDRLKQKNKLSSQTNKLYTRQLFIVFLSIFLVLSIIIFFSIYKRIKDSKEKQRLKNITLEKESQLAEVRAQESKRLVELKNRLFANISHEFRTPLTLIQAPVEGLMKTANEKDTVTLNNIQNNTDQLLVMVDEMLELAKLDAGNVSLSSSSISFFSFIYKIKANFSDLYTQKNIDFSIEMDEEDFAIVADEHRLRIVLNNLLKNAFHHTPSGGSVILSVLPNKQEDELNVQLFNRGNQIDEDFLPVIFDRYARGEQEQYSGYGIGLSLCKEIISLHKGSIEVNNTNEGVLFSFTIPTSFEGVEKPKMESLASEIEGESTLDEKKDKTILIVEDNYEIQNLLRDILSASYHLAFADNGLEGLEAAKELQPDLIISDIMMPVMEGIELTKELKEELATSHIPIVLLTAKSTHQGKVEGLESGADDYLTKPFSPKELIVRVKNLLQQRDLLRERFSKNVFLQAEDFTSNKLDKEFLIKATDVVHQNLLNADFTVELFCRELSLNRNSVHQKMKSLTGLSASQFIRSIKLKKAAEYLLDDRLSMIEISEMAGFNSRQAFNKVFKEQFEMTPSNYRKTHSQK